MNFAQEIFPWQSLTSVGLAQRRHQLVSLDILDTLPILLGEGTEWINTAIAWSSGTGGHQRCPTGERSAIKKADTEELARHYREARLASELEQETRGAAGAAWSSCTSKPTEDFVLD